MAKIFESKQPVHRILPLNIHPQTLNMKNTIKKLLAVALLSALAISSLPAQTNLPTFGGVLSGKDLTAIQVAKITAETDIAQRKMDDEMQMLKNREDARKMMVHDLAWNSWVLAVLGGILFCGLFRTKRDRQMQETVRLMVEKGTPITPEIITALKSKATLRPSVDPYGYLTRALILVAVGSGLLVAHYMYGCGFAMVEAGWIVLLIGVANLILWIADRLTSKSGQSK